MKRPEPEKRPVGRPATGKTPQRQIRCPDDEWALFERAASAEGVSVAVWLRQVALRAAKRALRAADE
jgi:hypothetical protein